MCQQPLFRSRTDDRAGHLDQRYAGMSLREIGAAPGGRDYGAVSMAIKRFETQAAHSRTLAEARRELAGMLNVEGVLPK
jgi:chromosomal replication initiation ATPase DnaA